MKPFYLLLSAFFLTGTFLSKSYAVTVLGAGHMDIDFNVNASGVWTMSLSHDEQGEFAVNTDAVLYASNEVTPTGNRTAAPGGASWSFIGTTAGSPIWIFSQVQGFSPDSVWPGFNTEATLASSLQAWDPLPTNVSSGKWIEISLLSMQYTGVGTVNNFSMWSTNSFGVPTSWMSTADGISALDSYYMGAGGHSHMNWGFTSEGIYDLTLQARTYLADGTYSASDPVTVRFGINATSVPEPGRIILLTFSLIALGLRRCRK